MSFKEDVAMSVYDEECPSKGVLTGRQMDRAFAIGQACGHLWAQQERPVSLDPAEIVRASKATEAWTRQMIGICAPCLDRDDVVRHESATGRIRYAIEPSGRVTVLVCRAAAAFDPSGSPKIELDDRLPRVVIGAVVAPMWPFTLEVYAESCPGTVLMGCLPVKPSGETHEGHVEALVRVLGAILPWSAIRPALVRAGLDGEETRFAYLASHCIEEGRLL